MDIVVGHEFCWWKTVAFVFCNYPNFLFNKRLAPMGLDEKCPSPEWWRVIHILENTRCFTGGFLGWKKHLWACNRSSVPVVLFSCYQHIYVPKTHLEPLDDPAAPWEEIFFCREFKRRLHSRASLTLAGRKVHHFTMVFNRKGVGLS